MSLNEDFNITKLRNFLSLTYNTSFDTVILLTKSDASSNNSDSLILPDFILLSNFDPTFLTKFINLPGFLNNCLMIFKLCVDCLMIFNDCLMMFNDF